ncbi:MAG: SDR family NAD(P)-dependent oxidoreductase [Bacteroidota bacterium]|nr:SDR family NAD(P)-dependent oxidoreductase [Bacteroidota bacterium]MDP4230809.1 SDR family NAD(P)-dependent oxidoreductase [Bacteroidota bacterium]MDP4235315.1 SDR family NAD(P)-dependent oxidoreductase [Bacteroidota bacterium]
MNIIITGASKGIGLAIAKTFAKQGTKHCIGICARNKNELRRAEGELKEISSIHDYYCAPCDVAHENEVNEFVSAFEDKFGPVDVLVNNAGFGIFKPVLEITKEEFESVLAVNLRGVFLFTRAVLPAMRKQKSGTVITISSLAAKNGFSGGTAYCASKFAVRGLMQCLFLEVRSDDIRFVTICPGSVDTDFFVSSNALPSQSLKSKKALKAEDVAECVNLAVQLRQNADLSELDIRPTNPKG